MDGTAVRVTVEWHWAGAWLLPWAAYPCVVLDGEIHEGRWSCPMLLRTSAGTHRVVTCCRFKHFSALLAQSGITVNLAAGQTRSIVARNGWDNGSPFRPRLIG